MKIITILATGSRGDVQPFVALAYALAQAGYKVRMICNHIYEPWISAYGLDMVPIHWDPRENLRLQNELATEKNPIMIFRRQMENSRAVFELTQSACWQACQGSDFLISSVLVPIGYSLAEKLNIPFLAGSLHPLEPTGEFPFQLISQNLGSSLNRASHRLAEQVYQFATGKYVNAFRATLELAPVRFPSTTLGILREKGIPLLCNLSPTVLPRPADWPNRIHMHGYWFLPASPGWIPPDSLMDFLNRGAAPVYIGFGSMVTDDPASASQMIIETLRKCGCRGILSKDPGSFSESGIDPDQFMLVDEIPHDWLFERMAVVVHHGGAGTTASALKAGVPQVVVPHMQDQPYWGNKMRQLGVAPVPVSRHRLNADDLAYAIRQAVEDKTMMLRAQVVGEKIRAEQGVEKTVAFIEQYFRMKPSQDK